MPNVSTIPGTTTILSTVPNDTAYLGILVVPDHIIEYSVNAHNQTVTVKVTDTGEDGELAPSETYECPHDNFHKAMMICLSWDGDGSEDDYELAEKAMPMNPRLRWIP